MAAQTKRNAWSVMTVLLITVVCGINVAHTARRMPPPPRVHDDDVPPNVVMRQEQRLAGVRAALRARGVQGTIGYLADLPAERLAADGKAMEDYFLSQFALAPWILDTRFEENEWTVANLRTASVKERVSPEFHVAVDFGAGVLLLKKGAP